jgi:acetate kinase
MKILVFNAGSSTQKSNLYELTDPVPEKAPEALWTGLADWSKNADYAELTITTASGAKLERKFDAQSRQHLVEQMLPLLWSGETQVVDKPQDIAIVGHRVVHGGHELQESTLITPEVIDTIKRLAEFAPLHNPANLDGIIAAQNVLGKTPQVAVFDTAFHRSLPPEVATYPAPYDWFEQGIRRYGFHGISHQYCSMRSAQIVGQDLRSLRIINCHLGNGCSLAAIKGGRSIDTTMGFTPLEGLMMGTRSGTIDPSILTYLQIQKGYTAQALENILNKQSGLKGISGVSGDMRSLKQAAKEGNQRARLALEMFLYRLRYFIGAMIASLGGVDVLTFTGGIGENDAELRARTCEAFAFLNLKIDPKKNAASPVDEEISTPDSAIHVLVVHTEEDWEIARECKRVVEAGSKAELPTR